MDKQIQVHMTKNIKVFQHDIQGFSFTPLNGGENWLIQNNFSWTN